MDHLYHQAIYNYSCNHFNLLINKQYEDIFNIPEEIKNLVFDDFSKLISKKIKEKRSFIKDIKISKIKQDKYVNFNKGNLNNYYKEIEEYLLDNNNIPSRLRNYNNLKKKFIKEEG